MGVKFVDGVLVLEDADANACPADPADGTICESCE